MLNSPFRDVHELYRIVFLRTQEQKKQAEAESKKQNSQESRRNPNNSIQNQNSNLADETHSSPSIINPDDIEDVLEDLTEGG